MVDVPSARALGFRLELHKAPMREILNSAPVEALLRSEAAGVVADVSTHVRATTSTEHAENYVQSLIVDEASSDKYGFDFSGPYALGSRPIVTVGVPAGRGPDTKAKPPLMTEAETHALSSVPGFTVGKKGESVR